MLTYENKERGKMKGIMMTSPRVDNASVPGLHQSPRRSMLGSASRSFRNLAGASTIMDKSVTHPPRHQTVRVFDEEGNDVTPQPLHPMKWPAKAAAQRHKFSRFLDEISLASASEMSGDSICSMPFSRSMTASLESPSMTELPIDSQDVEQKTETVMEDVTEDMLREEIYVHMTETDLITVLDIPSISVSVNSDDAQGVLENNRRYAEVCSSCSGTDKYVSDSVQTLRGPAKNKQAQTDCVVFLDTAIDPFNALSTPQSESGSSVNPQLMNYKKAAPDSRKPAGEAAEETSLSTSTSSTSTSRSTISFSATSSRASWDETGSGLNPELELELLMSSRNFYNSLQLMERVILANTFQHKFISYRLLPDIKDWDVNMEKVEQLRLDNVREEKVPQPPAVELLWVFSCELTRGLSVNTMAWNKKNPDLLAVGYGNFDFGYQKPGLVCCWSIKNTKWPNRVIQCDGPVTSVDFSFKNPSQLAVGLLDGTIVIYNIHDQDIKSCVFSTNESPSRHMGPVWQLKWCHQSLDFSTKKDCVDSVFSVAADGRISRWNQGSSGLDCIDLMKLGRVLHIQKKATTEEKADQECVLTSLIPALAFDFHSVDSNIYLIGTWDGLIHKCTSSNTQHFLEIYKSHLCSVNAVAWSPFSPDVFLSCSSDCTIQLWKQYHLRPLLTFMCVTGAVEDIKWSERQAAVFGAVSKRQLEIWDLSLNIQEPVIVQPSAPTVNMKNLLFCTQTDCVLVGDSNGAVSVYQIKNLHAESSQVDILDGIISSALSS